MHRIALNALGRNVGGVESYIYNLVQALLLKDKINSYYLFISNDQRAIYQDLLVHKNFKLVSYPINCSNPVIRVIWQNTFMLLDIIKHKIDLVHHLCNYIPRISPYNSIVTIHDLIPFYYHDKHPGYKETNKSYKYFKKVASYVTAKAKKIITVSDFTKKQLLSYFKIDQDKISVIGQSFDTRKNIKGINLNILENFGISGPYILAVSVIRPHKNFDFLVKVFNILKSKYNLPHKLVIVGDIHFGEEKFLYELENSNYKGEIFYLSHIEAADLAYIYSHADIFVYPSLYEGFGIPLLEAMNFRIPVVASNAASLPEVGGDACLYFNPYDEVDACEKILKIINDDIERSKLVAKQKARLDYYSWDNVTTAILGVYKEILGNKND